MRAISCRLACDTQVHRWGEDGYVKLSREDPERCAENSAPSDGTACQVFSVPQ